MELSTQKELNVCEIFRSIEGETSLAGFPAVFIRLAGCNLHCAYCDTGYSRNDGKILSIEEIADLVDELVPFHHITITGGEPLYQKDMPLLAHTLLSKGYRVRVETNGSYPISMLPFGCERMIDVKGPSSGHAGSFLEENIIRLTLADELKFVIADKKDFDFLTDFLKSHSDMTGVTINVTPASEMISAEELGKLVLESKQIVRVNIQIHKILFPNGEK